MLLRYVWRVIQTLPDLNCREFRGIGSIRHQNTKFSGSDSALNNSRPSRSLYWREIYQLMR